MTRLRTFLKFAKFYRSLGYPRLKRLRMAWVLSRYA